MTKKPLLLCILDGWGVHDAHDDDAHNAILQANTPNFDRFLEQYPHSQLETSGLHVGLPDGQMGNSEVGHMNIGSGRIVMQSLPRIDAAVESGELRNNGALLRTISTLKDTGGALHIMGLVSDGGVHAHVGHIVALAQYAAEAGVSVVIHTFTDGRDTMPGSVRRHVRLLQGPLASYENVTFATMTGRYFAMDRDKRWDRVQRAYDVITQGKAEHEAATLDDAVAAHLESDVTDEFFPATVIGDYAGMNDGDGILMANFRADRAREILTALVDPEFDGFEREKVINLASKLGMVEYSVELNAHMELLFPPEQLSDILGEVVSREGLKQLRIAETEKYAHVTFFFNGGTEAEFDGEDRILIPSPHVATYDEKPEMSAPEVTEALVKAINDEAYDVIICNYANTDMVGHTGDINAAIKAVEAVDACLGFLEKAIVAKGGAMLVTADHGNAELMKDPESNGAHTSHTTFPVPFVGVGLEKSQQLASGRLCDIAPTMLKILGITQPSAMTGNALL